MTPQPPPKGTYPYLTLDEMRRNPDLIDVFDRKGGRRFANATVKGFFEKYVSKKETSILDTGAMFGEFAHNLQEQGFTDVHAVDFADMRKFPLKNFHVLDMNSEKFPYENGRFDVVTAWGLIEHLENPYHFLREVHRVLKDDGLYILSFPNIEHIVTRLMFLKNADMRNWEKWNNHIALYPKGIFEKTYLRYFDVLEKAYYGDGVVLPPYFLWNKLQWLFPKNRSWTCHHVFYVLKKKPFIPFA